MTEFMDIAVVRIQRWLGRAPNLRGRRGASALIREATDPANVAPLLARWEGVAVRCEAAGNIDGVIPLELKTEDRYQRDALATHLVGHLRSMMPAASFKVERRSGPDWLSAQLQEPKRDEWPAPTSEWPLGKRCDWCGEWPANGKAVVGAGDDRGPQWLCIDCLQRDQHAGYATSKRTEVQPGTERDLLERWEERFAHRPMGVPDTFEELAALGEIDDATHLATIHADGNAIGRFRQQVHEALGKDERLAFDLPKEIQDATWSALVDGLDIVTDTDAITLPVIAHLVGGDDVLLSLPAHRAWRFAVQLQHSFERHLEQRVRRAGLDDSVVPSISAAIVFHHYKSPLAANADLADDLLTAAKEEHFGTRAALAWHDRTHEGPKPSGRPSASRAEVEAHWSTLEELAGQPKSRTANLAALARSADRSRLTEHAGRLGMGELVAELPGDPLAADNPLNLANMLGMTRWWGDAR